MLKGEEFKGARATRRVGFIVLCGKPEDQKRAQTREHAKTRKVEKSKRRESTRKREKSKSRIFEFLNFWLFSEKHEHLWPEKWEIRRAKARANTRTRQNAKSQKVEKSKRRENTRKVEKSRFWLFDYLNFKILELLKIWFFSDKRVSSGTRARRARGQLSIRGLEA